MRPHLRYLRYVLLHKLYVFAGGLAIARSHSRRYETPWWYWPRTLWRLLIHDLSKFRPSEWSPYVDNFYRNAADDLLREMQLKTVVESDERYNEFSRRLIERKGRMNRAFDVAWLRHIHRNDHHWQHWVLREDSGATKVLLPPAYVVDEMVADWIGAGTKILSWPMMHEVIAKTVAWFVENQSKMQLRDVPRQRVIDTLTNLCIDYELVDAGREVIAASHARESITLASPVAGGLARVESRR